MNQAAPKQGEVTGIESLDEKQASVLSEKDESRNDEHVLRKRSSKASTLSDPESPAPRSSLQIALKRTGSRRTPHPLCVRCRHGLTEEEGEPCDMHEGIDPEDPDIVTWDGDHDPKKPQNWPRGKKVAFSAVAGLMVFAVSFSSSVFGPATHITASQYGVSAEVMNLAISLHICGFALGPLIFGPMSEVFGRTIPLWTGLAGLTIFQIPQALAGNVRTILVCRFFEGTFGSAIFAVVSGMMVDVWDPITRGVALALTATCINLGSTVAPVVGGFVVSTVGWRWTAWITALYCLSLGIAGLFLIHESFEPVLLARKAKRLRFQTRKWALHAKSEESPHDIKVLIQKYLTKPVRMFFLEPILIILTIYMTLVYGILYLAYQAFPYSFQQHGWKADVSELPFIAIALGILSAWGLFSLYTLTYYRSKAHKGQTCPEDRVLPMIAGSFILPPSLFWFGWSTYTHWASQLIAGYFIGLGLLLIFISGIVYLVDVYLINANSAMSIHVVVRSIVASSFPLFATPMYNKLGTAWASTLLGFLCLLMVPFPLIFYYYGARIRSWSRFSFSM